MKRSAAWVGLGLLLATGCVRHSARQGDDPNRGERVLIQPGHLHSAECGHYHHNGSWYFLPEHFHREGCGHHYYAGEWNYAARADFPPTHRHDSYCGHYLFAGSWYWAEGHWHGENCGHRYNQGVWSLDK
jgi:hypothetical protein